MTAMIGLKTAILRPTSISGDAVGPTVGEVRQALPVSRGLVLPPRRGCGNCQLSNHLADDHGMRCSLPVAVSKPVACFPVSSSVPVCASVSHPGGREGGEGVCLLKFLFAALIRFYRLERLDRPMRDSRVHPCF